MSRKNKEVKRKVKDADKQTERKVISSIKSCTKAQHNLSCIVLDTLVSTTTTELSTDELKEISAEAKNVVSFFLLTQANITFLLSSCNLFIILLCSFSLIVSSRICQGGNSYRQCV